MNPQVVSDSFNRRVFLGATAAGDVLFFTCKDSSHSLHGIKAA